MTRPDRELKSIRSIGEPIVDEDGKLTMMVGTAQDITDRKRAEEERANLLPPRDSHRTPPDASAEPTNRGSNAAQALIMVSAAYWL